MPRRKAENWVFLNTETGQTIDAILSPHHRGLGGRWMKLFQDSRSTIIKENPKIQGASLRVLTYLEGSAKWENRIPVVAHVVEALGMRQPHVSRAYTELLKVGFLVKYEGEYRLSPLVYWKGTERQHEEALRSLYQAGALTHARPAIEGHIIDTRG